MFYFEIIIRDSKTAIAKTVETSFNSFTTGYFEAWKMALDKAKRVIDGMEKPFDWVIESITDVTRR